MLKKLSLSLIASAAIITSANADLLSISAGAGAWQEKIDGYIKVNGDTNYWNNKAAETDGDAHTGNLGIKDTTSAQAWVKVIHPLPMIPNVRASILSYSSSGDGIAVGSLKVFGKSIPISGRAHTQMDINQIDLTFFYEFNPVFVDLEAGFGVNTWLGHTEVTTADGTSTTDWSVVLPYLYARMESMSLFGISVEGSARYISDGGDNYYEDFNGGVKYHLPLPILDISLKAGYRHQEVQGVDGDDKTIMKFDGAFAEVGVKF